METLFEQIHPMFVPCGLPEAAIKSATLPSSSRILAGNSNNSRINQSPAFEENFIYPLSTRAMSAPKLPQSQPSSDELREKYWGKYPIIQPNFWREN